MKQSLRSMFHTKRPLTVILMIAGAACLLTCLLTIIIASLRPHDEAAGPTDYEDITVNGDFGAPIIVSMPDNFQEPTSVKSRVLIEGEGDEIVAGDAILLRTSSFDSRTGKIISEYGEGTLHLIHVNEEGLGDFTSLVIGQKEGTRLLIARPEKVDGEPASEIIVMDLLHLTAQGASKEPGEYATEIIPEVSLSDQGVPQIHAQGKRVDKLSSITLIAGSGAQVDADQKIAIQYVITDGRGKIIDSTWETRSPVLFDLDSERLMQGVREGLENQKVGSRVLIVIPSSLAEGDGDRIAVVDILATETKQGGKKK